MFTDVILSQLTKTLTGSLVGASGRRLRRAFADPDRAQALERCCEAGIVAMIQAAHSGDEEERKHLGDVLRAFFTSEEISQDLGTAVAPLLKGQHLDLAEMKVLFEDAGYDPETLPSFDFDGAFTAFAGGFAAAAREQEILRGEVQTHLLFSQLELQREMRDALREMAAFLAGARPGTAAISAETITAENVAGTQIVFSSPTVHLAPAGTAAEPEDEAHRLRSCYLHRVMDQAGFLALSGVDPAVTGSESDAALRLDAVYTALLTQSPQDPGELAGRGRAGGDPGEGAGRQPRRAGALDQLNRHDRLVLLGDPGSGKSTFLNFVALCLAGELLGSQRANLELLTAPLPREKKEEEEEAETPPAWDLGPLLPVRIILRDFAARGLPERGEPGDAEGLWRFLEGELERASLADYAPHLKKTLQRDGGLILLDGLDEVPEAEGRRRQILESVQDFAATFERCRFLVTCRTYAYQHQEWRLPRFAEAVLESLNEAQIRHFVDRWYAHMGELRDLDADDARGRAELLKAAIFGSGRLLPLAERPLLLTLMASLHAWRGGSLPERREELYHDAVQLLLDFWEQRRVVVDAKGKPVVRQESLAEWLRVDRGRVRRLLNELAYSAHAAQPDLAGTADVAEADLVARLMKLADNPDVKPGRLVEYLRDRAGLLLARGVGVYTFPHRTFQEYLAACHLTDHDFPDGLAKLARADKERWREVALLAAAKAARGSAASPWLLADALCFRPTDHEAREDEDAHGGHLAGLVLAESADLGGLGERLTARLDHVRTWQVDLLSGAQLPARDRAECGRSLARLGDPRPEATSVDGMELCWVPPGPFRMGSDSKERYEIYPETPADDLDLADGYWIGRFPVTQAQFQAFAEAGGYAEARYWPEAIEAGSWKEGILDVDEWRDRRSEAVRVSGPQELNPPFDLPNHPVVAVNRFEACAFCRWLTDRLHASGGLPQSWRVDLPNEPEWEKAARGGYELPPSLLKTAAGRAAEANTRTQLVEHPEPRRRYPWGDDVNAERASYDETGLGSTNAVGCFPSGRSPYGCEEMSGGVWEWTRNQPKDYPYDPADGRENLEGASRWVLRGGSFGVDDVNVRCAVRYDIDPTSRGGFVGFRVVFSPSGL